MDKTLIVGSPNINGNVGSCQVNSTDISMDSWTVQTVAVNSCTGEIVATNTYFSWGTVIFVVVIGIFIFSLSGMFLKMIFD